MATLTKDRQTRELLVRSKFSKCKHRVQCFCLIKTGEGTLLVYSPGFQFLNALNFAFMSCDDEILFSFFFIIVFTLTEVVRSFIKSLISMVFSMLHAYYFEPTLLQSSLISVTIIAC